MMLCEECPQNPACQNCVHALRAGVVEKVIPARKVRVKLSSGQTVVAEMRAISRTAVGLYCADHTLADSVEVELASDFRILGSAFQGIRDVHYYVVDITKVFRRDEVLQRLLMEEFLQWHHSGENLPNEWLTELKDVEDERHRLIREELQKLSILRQVQSIYLYVMENGVIRPIGAKRTEEPLEGDLERVAWEAVKKGASVREQLISGDGSKMYELYASPLPDQTCGLALIDVTEAIAEERARQRKEWELYKQVLMAVTQDKLVLLTDAEMVELATSGQKVATLKIRSAGELSGLRSVCKQFLSDLGIVERRSLQFLVAVNEAATNTIKHGAGGTVTIHISPEEKVLRVIVHDQGQGILLEELPRATLRHGYSSKHSLGAGFHVMLQFSDRLCIGTSTTGNKFVLETAII
ncbi:ATP-binding protein [Brevibacillus ruminantium]|uniref:ATP-binding protein n=1 Tax=Brevibacillus ruminantium TaxID=2950604 RepID=A0ABY4WFQ1_9BACL|nr:ATP-binding protein [Brevibacillus ruminantium]USG64144.1 ATP-binding protein [Brevibacillus ruminantium]